MKNKTTRKDGLRTSEAAIWERIPTLLKQWHPEKNQTKTPETANWTSDEKIWWKCEKGHEWAEPIIDRAKAKNDCPCCSKENKLLATNSPMLIPFWHPTKNGSRTPFNTYNRAAEPASWICEKGHEWECTPHSQSRTNICPYCSGKKVLAEFNSLAITHPEVAATWHPTKNEKDPEDVLATSNKEAWWLYRYTDPKTGKQYNFEWPQAISARVKAKILPFQNNTVLFVGYNDLATVNPKLALEWNATKNGGLTPRDVTTKKSTRVWWQCENGHEWQDTVAHRHMGYGCPHCREEMLNSAHVKVRLSTEGCDDLATTHPELASQWHPTKNKIHSPHTLTADATNSVWWQMPYEDPNTQRVFVFEWQESVRRRVLNPICPFVRGTRKWPGFNTTSSLTEVGFIAEMEENKTKQNNPTEEDFSEKFFI